jgi:hypothetical protein
MTYPLSSNHVDNFNCFVLPKKQFSLMATILLDGSDIVGVDTGTSPQCSTGVCCNVPHTQLVTLNSILIQLPPMEYIYVNFINYLRVDCECDLDDIKNNANTLLDIQEDHFHHPITLLKNGQSFHDEYNTL